MPVQGDGAEGELATSETTTASAAAAQNSQADQGLTLTSIAIGPRRSAATISGERYCVGDDITAGGKDKAATGPKFRVSKITPEGVELQGQGRIIVLHLSKSRLASGDTIVRMPGRGDRQSEDD
jgi:hypothetical protein